MFFNTFRTRLITVLALALLPALVLAIVESVRNYNTATELADRTMVAQAVMSVEKEKSSFIEARRTIETIAQLPGITQADPETCRSTVAGIYAATEIYDRIAVVQQDGELVCSVPDFPGEAAFEGNPLLADIYGSPTDKVTGQFTDVQTGHTVVATLTPARSIRGEIAGHVIATLRVTSLERQLNEKATAAAPLLALVNHDGGVIAAADGGGGGLGAFPPKEEVRPHLRDDVEFFNLEGPNGASLQMAAAPLVSDDVFLLIGAQNNVWQSRFAIGLIIAIMAPLAMYALALSVAWYAVDHLVVRHIHRLRLVVERIERGEESVRASEDAGAPEEIEVLVTHMNAMLDALDQREDELGYALEKQKALTKEVYHRVKNNLQIISSVMNLQLRSAESELAKTALLAAQKRILAMSTVHEQLYNDANLSKIRLDALLSDLTRIIQGGLREDSANTPTELDVAAVTTDPDRAIPIALLYTEALTNAYENSVGGEEGGVVRITLTEAEPGFLNLTITNKRRANMDVQPKTGLGVKLIEVLTRQLRGTVTLVEDNKYCVDLTFPNTMPCAEA